MQMSVEVFILELQEPGRHCLHRFQHSYLPGSRSTTFKSDVVTQQEARIITDILF